MVSRRGDAKPADDFNDGNDVTNDELVWLRCWVLLYAPLGNSYFEVKLTFLVSPSFGVKIVVILLVRFCFFYA